MTEQQYVIVHQWPDGAMTIMPRVCEGEGAAHALASDYQMTELRSTGHSYHIARVSSHLRVIINDKLSIEPTERDREMAGWHFADPILREELTRTIAKAREEGRRNMIANPRLAHLEDAYRYLYSTKEHSGKFASVLYSDWAILSLCAAGETELAKDLEQAQTLVNPKLFDKLFDKLWDQVQAKLEQARNKT
jgi:hypothetical protein